MSKPRKLDFGGSMIFINYDGGIQSLYVETPELFLNEIYRVLKKDGIGILQVPIDKGLEKTYEDNTLVSKKQRAEHFGQYDHVRVYGKDYKNRLEDSGFTVNIIDFTNEIKDDEIYKYVLINVELIPIVTK